MKKHQIIAAIDIGSCHIRAALAHFSADGDIMPIAFAETPSKGVKKGGVVNIALVQHAIDVVLDQLQSDGAYHIHSIVAALSGVSIMGYNADGTVDIKGNTISEHHVGQVVATAKEMSMLESRQMLHILKQHFSIDNQNEIDNPIGLMGNQLSVQVHVISVAKTAYYNLLQTFSHRDIDVDYVISSGFASAVAAATADEKQLGVCVLDIGSGTTELTVMSNGIVRHSEVIAMGGELITADIAFFMRTTIENAEAVKKQLSINYHYAPEEVLEVQGVGEGLKTYYKSDVANVMRDRCEQMVDIIVQKLMRAGMEESFPGGFVICGGCAHLNGLSELLMHKTQLPVRCASLQLPLESDLQESCRFATLMGLFMCAYEEDYVRVMTANEKAGIMTMISKPFAFVLKQLKKQF